MGYDYKRGRQVIIHDKRLKTPTEDLTGPPSPVTHWAHYADAEPPEAWLTYQVDREKESIGTVLSLVESGCATAGLPKGTRFDALHIMAHGNVGYVELGKEGLKKQNAYLMAKVGNRFRYVVFYCCLVGRRPRFQELGSNLSALEGSLFARKVAVHAKAKVILARNEQIYHAHSTKDPTRAVLNFGDWEGLVDLYEEGQPVRTFNGPQDEPFDLETLIFGAARKP